MSNFPVVYKELNYIKFIKYINIMCSSEIHPTSTSKRRYSQSPIGNHSVSSEGCPDEAYTKALFKFNEWRKQKQFGTLSKKNQKHFETMSRKLEFIKHKNNTEKNKLPSHESILNDNDFYEEIGKQRFSKNIVKDKYKNKQNKINNDSQNDLTSNLKNIDAIKKSITNNTIIYENKILELESQNHVNEDNNLVHSNKELEYISSPPVKFYSFSEENESKTSRYIVHKKKVRESLPLYHTMINKHGDIVDYALPVVENAVDDFSQTPHSRSFLEYQSDGVINKHEFLETVCSGKNLPEIIENTNYNGIPQIESVIVTDLDKTIEKSDYINIKSNVRTENIMKELETLEKWSKSIDINVSTKNNRTNIDEKFTGVIICPISDVKINSHDPIQLYGSRIYSGTFRGALISEQKREHLNITFQDEAILLNFEKLRCLRHPDIALLMGVTIDSNKILSSLILESFKCSLKEEIHKNDNHIDLLDVIKYSIQLTKAVIYCHENGLIHSNICSESILLSSSNKYLKLSSFELATKRDNTRNIENCEKEIALNFLPHFVNYRQNYSNHCYQSPELITTNIKFIFPTNQSDIYGICLTVWEMLNKTTPFAFFNYKELEDLFYLQKAFLPIVEEKRCEQFKYILEKGLQIKPENRFVSAKHLHHVLMQISDVITTTPIVTNFVEGVASASSSSRIIHGTTSTIKKRKIIKSNFYERVDTIKNISNCPKPQYISEYNYNEELKSNNAENIIETNDFHLPKTPIARNNQLFSAEKISPIQKLEESRECSNNVEQSDKIYNVKIRIFPKDSNKEEFSNKISESTNFPKDDINNYRISNQINYWNSISSPEIVGKNLLKKGKEKETIQTQFIKNDTIENINMTDSIGYTFVENENQLSIPMAALLKESLGKRCRNSTTSFEDSLWRREKRICQNSDIYHKKIDSVKDTVNKFESFSNKLKERNQNSTFDLHSSKLLNKALEKDREKLLDNKSIIYLEKNENIKNSAQNDDIKQTNNLENDKTKTTSMEVKLKNFEKCKKKLYKSSFDIVLDNRNMETSDSDKESKLVKLNLQKINRSTDINWFCHKFRIHDTKPQYTRHSICGTELLTQLGKSRQLNFEKLNDDFSRKYKAIQTKDENSMRSHGCYKIQVGKLTCWNCGCKVFAVNDMENENIRLTENISLSPVTHIQHSKSTEDLYIDDDFYQDILLGANMELGTESELYNFF